MGVKGRRIDDSKGRECSGCGVFKLREEFYTTSRVRKDGSRPLMPRCIPCTAERNKVNYDANPAAHAERVKQWTERQDPEAYKQRLRENRLRREYGLTVDDWERLYDEQLGRCGVCHLPLAEVRPAVDHDHATGAVRGILCFQCNSALGLLGDDPERIERAATYLRGHLSSEQGRRDEDAAVTPGSTERR